LFTCDEGGGLGGLDAGLDADDVGVRVEVDVLVDVDVLVVVGVVVVVVLVVVVVVGVVVAVVSLDGVVVVVVGASPVDDPGGGGPTTVELPSLPVTVVVSVSGTPGLSGFVNAHDVGVLDLFASIGSDLLVSVHTSPPVASRTAISAAAKISGGRRYHGSAATGAAASSGGTNCIGGRALLIAVASGS
jgi:hypothetical protein